MARLIVLRPRKPMAHSEFESAKAYFARNTKFDILLLPSDNFDVMVEDAEPDTVDDITQENVETQRKVLVDAYNEGRVIEYLPVDCDPAFGWNSAHKHANPHVFNWDAFLYRLPAPRR